MHIFHDESGIFAPSTKPGSFSLVVAYVLSAPQYRAAKNVLRRHKLRNIQDITKESLNKEFKRSKLNGAEEPYFRLLEELAQVGGILVAVGSDVSGNTEILEYQKEYCDDILSALKQQCTADEEVLIRKQAADIRDLSQQNFTELACRVRLGWEVLQRATGYYAQRAPGALRRREWHYDFKDKNKNNPFDVTLKSTMVPLMKRHAFIDPLQLIKGADYKHLGDALIKTPEGFIVQAKPLLESIEFVNSDNSDGVQLADLLANGLFGVLHDRFKDRERAATLLGKLMVSRKHTLLFPTMNYSNQSSRRTPEIESIMHTMLAAARPLAVVGFPIRKVGDVVV